ncbi:hypothetical protein CR956_01650 [Candidatus Saccharibacteria bacterium]|nr:MAG: hypothetical protein CR956_01650 [Candidatus Saccharibacteria bacterium]
MSYWIVALIAFVASVLLPPFLNNFRSLTADFLADLTSVLLLMVYMLFSFLAVLTLPVGNIALKILLAVLLPCATLPAIFYLWKKLDRY